MSRLGADLGQIGAIENICLLVFVGFGSLPPFVKNMPFYFRLTVGGGGRSVTNRVNRKKYAN